MELSLKNYKTALPKELLKQAEKNVVRECDETKKGHYVAYVDEGNETFDVSLTLLPDKQVSSSTCDCKNGSSFCRHKTALLIHIAKGTKTTQSVKAKKKSKSEALLDEAEPGELKEWLRELLQKNKDIELSFTHYFSSKHQQYTPDEITKLTEEAIKAVVKNRKNIDPTQLKKVVELWTDIHAPIVKTYQANVADEKAFINFHTVIDTCLQFNTTINTGSNRIPKYVEGLLQQTAESVNNLYNEEAWEKAICYFIDNTFDKYSARMHYVNHLKNIISISSETRRKVLIDELAKLHVVHRSQGVINGHQYAKVLFGIMEEYELINKYVMIFKPITFDNEFNIKLLRILIDKGETKIAQQYCETQIRGNYREEYNIPYLEFLKEIYIIEKDEANLAKVLSELFPYTYHFEDFLYIYDRINDVEEKKKWRTKILSRARNASNNYNKAATAFIFKLMDYEKKYSKMIDYIDDHTPYSILLEYFEPMALTNKMELLKAIINKSDGFFHHQAEEEGEKEFFPELLAALLKHFSRELLTMTVVQAMKQKYYYSPNRFVRYLLSCFNISNLRAV